MKILLVAEGKHELYDALENLVRRIMQRDDLEFDTDRVSSNDIHAVHGKGQGFFKRSIRWLLDAKKRGYDAIVLVIDEDGKPERSIQINDAQADKRATAFPCAFGVAIKTFDAWMLADEQALTQVLEIPVQRQRNPEAIQDPKGICAALLDNSTNNITQTAMYAAVAKVAHLEIVKERCPDGFQPFAQRIENLAR